MICLAFNGQKVVNTLRHNLSKNCKITYICRCKAINYAHKQVGSKSMQITKLILIMNFFILVVQGQPLYENIVFEGAGIKGLAYAGVIKGLEERHLINDIKRVGGTSAGAITAMMLAIGYSADEIYEIISATKFQRFNQGRFSIIGGTYRMKNLYGWYRSERFQKWLEEAIERKTGDSEITFNELKEKGFKELYLVATCLNKQKRVILSNETYPNMKVKDAVKISMSIPLYFEASFVDEEGRIVKEERLSDNIDIMVDGGIIGNFPIDIFDKIEEDEAGNQTRIANDKTIGVRIDTDGQIANDKSGKGLEDLEIKNLKSYINAFYIFTIESLNRNNLTKSDWERTGVPHYSRH